MNWVNFNPKSVTTADGTATVNGLDAWIYNYHGVKEVSGICRDFSLQKQSNICFSVNLYAAKGQTPHCKIYIAKNNRIIESKEFIISDKSTRYAIDATLTQGDYKIIIGYDDNHEFGITSDNLVIEDYVVITNPKNEPTHSRSLWCWEESCIKTPEAVLSMAKKLNVDAIYQEATTPSIYTDPALFTYIDLMHSHGIDVYFVFGKAEWYNSVATIKEKIDIAKNFNTTNPTHMVDGVIFDVEPHTLPQTDGVTTDQKVNIWRATAKEAYIYANTNNVRVIFCNPTWYNYETIYSFAKYSDGISLMNYAKTGMLNHINEEIAITKATNGWIENITEFQQPPHVVEDDTFYNEGIAVAHDMWSQLRNKYNYKKLAFSYHYYLPLVDLVKKYTNKSDFIPVLTNSKEIKTIPKISGQLLFTMDTGELFLDIDESKRSKITSDDIKELKKIVSDDIKEIKIVDALPAAEEDGVLYLVKEA